MPTHSLSCFPRWKNFFFPPRPLPFFLPDRKGAAFFFLFSLFSSFAPNPNGDPLPSSLSPKWNIFSPSHTVTQFFSPFPPFQVAVKRRDPFTFPLFPALNLTSLFLPGSREKRALALFDEWHSELLWKVGLPLLPSRSCWFSLLPVLENPASPRIFFSARLLKTNYS